MTPSERQTDGQPASQTDRWTRAEERRIGMDVGAGDILQYAIVAIFHSRGQESSTGSHLLAARAAGAGAAPDEPHCHS